MLVAYARRVPTVRGLLPETVFARLGPWQRSRLGRFLDRNAYTNLAYVGDWLEAFRAAPGLAVESCNVADAWALQALRIGIRRYPLIVILHSAAGDDLSLLGWLAPKLADRRGTLLVFFGNEYTGMREKIAFARRTGADFIATQLPIEAGRWLYERAPSATILHAPAALNPLRFKPLSGARPIDIGFRGDRHPSVLGDADRNRMIEYFQAHGPDLGLRTDIAFERIDADAWAAFLNRCNGIVGAESGTYCLDRDGTLEDAVREHLTRRPQADAREVFERYYSTAAPVVSGKAISSRHFEAIGTRTCQLLLEGRYNDVLRPEEHYLGVQRDFSNVPDVIARFKDPAERAALTERALAHVLGSHTYARRVRDVLDAMPVTRNMAQR